MKDHGVGYSQKKSRWTLWANSLQDTLSFQYKEHRLLGVKATWLTMQAEEQAISLQLRW